MIPYHQYDTTGLHQAVYPVHNQPHQEQQSILPRLLFKLPRVVTDQKKRYLESEIFKKHIRETEIRYTLHRDRPLNERQTKYQAGCLDGHTEISFPASGLVILLSWTPSTPQYQLGNSFCDFNKEIGKVHILVPLIVDGVSVKCKGWMDLERLDGVACLEFDEELAAREDAILQQQVEMYSQRIKEYEERCRRTDLQMKKLQQYS